MTELYKMLVAIITLALANVLYEIIMKEVPNMGRAFERTFFQSLAALGYEAFF